MLSQLTRLAWRNIFYTPKKSLLAVSAVGACYFFLNVFQGYIVGSETIFLDSYSRRSMYGDVIIRRAGTQHALSLAEKDQLAENEQAAIEGILAKGQSVDTFTRFLRVSGTITNGIAQTIFTAVAHDVESGKKMRAPNWGWNALAGRPLETEQESSILLGKALGSLLGCDATTNERYITGQGGYAAKARPFHCQREKMQLQAATVSGQANAIEVEVAGLIDAMFRDLDLRYAHLPLEVGQRLLNTKGITYYGVRLLPGASEASFLETFRVEAMGAGLALTAHSWKEDELGDFYRRTMDFLHVFRNFMVVVILAVALLSIFNTFYRSVQERIREIGVLRTLGFRLVQVRSLFLQETFFLAVIGISIGGVLALITSFTVNRLSILYKVGLLTQPIPFLVDLSAVTLTWTALVVLGVAMLAALIPLVITGRKRITEALTHT